MNYSDFETSYLNELKSQNNNCINIIDQNEKLLIKYFGEKKDNKTLKNFINKLNEVVLSKDNNFKLIEKSLFHPLFKNVYTEFRESDILIRACKNENKPLIKWLLTMNISSSVQDEQGMTALMYASENPELLFVLKALLNEKEDNKSLYLVDKNGENAFFHAVHNMKGLELLLESKMRESVNQLNNNKDSVLTYCCRNNIYEPVITLIKNAYVDPNIFNNEERTAMMYLVENGRYDELEHFKKWKTNFEFKNSKNETAVSILIHQYYKYYQEEGDTLKYQYIKQNYIKVIKVLIDKGCNFNTIIDDEGNTAFMFFLWIQDWHTIVYLLLQHKDLDFKTRNIYGINASLLCSNLKITEASCASKINIHNLLSLYLDHNRFNSNCRDLQDNNLLMYFIFNNDFNTVFKLLRINEDLINQVNDKKETPLMIAIKLGQNDIAKYFIKRNIFLDNQDKKGNTALHYALELGDKYTINLLAYYHADIYIKNNEGKSPIEIAKENENDELIKLLKSPIIPNKLLNEINNNNNKNNKNNNNNKEKNKITSFFKKNKGKINNVEINNGDIIISKSNTYQKEYEDSFLLSSELYHPLNNVRYIELLEDYEKSIYPLYNRNGAIDNYNREVWTKNPTELIIYDDKVKRTIRSISLATELLVLI